MKNLFYAFILTLALSPLHAKASQKAMQLFTAFKSAGVVTETTTDSILGTSNTYQDAVSSLRCSETISENSSVYECSFRTIVDNKYKFHTAEGLEAKAIYQSLVEEVHPKPYCGNSCTLNAEEISCALGGKLTGPDAKDETKYICELAIKKIF